MENVEDNDRPGKRPKLSKELIVYRDEDLEQTIQPHDVALVVTSRRWLYSKESISRSRKRG